MAKQQRILPVVLLPQDNHNDLLIHFTSLIYHISVSVLILKGTMTNGDIIMRDIFHAEEALLYICKLV